MKAKTAVLILTVLCFLSGTNLFAQEEESPINIYGYFQTQFFHKTDNVFTGANNTFNAQQLNIFFQKNLGDKWKAFTNIELVNTFSSNRNTGQINLEEAWGMFKPSDKFSLKAGLLIPTYNNLNAIKNRWPILPYSIRPLAYENSLGSVIDLQNVIPYRAFAEAAGWLPAGEAKIDYAVFLGNSPNIVKKGTAGAAGTEGKQSGIDSTTTFLIGGRFGLRYEGFKAGVSFTRDKSNKYVGVGEKEAARTRVGFDVSLDADRFHLTGEYTKTTYDTDFTYGPQVPLPIGMVDGTIDDKNTFYYGMAGLDASDDLFVYFMYNNFDRHEYPFVNLLVKMPSGGLTYSFNYRVKLKVQVSKIEAEMKRPAPTKDDWMRYDVALSIFF